MNKTVRIQNDGVRSRDTTITDVNTGKLLEHVTAVDISIDVDQDYPVALIMVSMPVIDITVNAKINYKCPHCSVDLGKLYENTRSLGD